MTLDEKIGQMAQADLSCVSNRSDVQTCGFGSMLSGGDSKPPQNNPAAWLRTVNELQSWALNASDAFITAWLPGTEGEGVADVLFGDTKPAGKLPREWPRNNEQAAANAMKGEPLFPFGFGMTY
jgi:hypothetical protein